MTIFSASRSSAIAATILGDVSLEQLRDALIDHKPSHADLEGGWAGTDDAQTNINSRNVAPPTSDPEILPAGGTYPRRLSARYYYFRSNSQLRNAFPDGTPQEQHVIGAFDMLAWEHETGKIAVLFSSRSAAAAGKLIKALREAIDSVDATARLEIDGGPLAFSPDLFFWLVVRARDNKNLGGGTWLDSVLAVNGHDNTNRATVLSDGVDFNRPALLVSVAEIEQLGPIRISLRDETLDARVSADVWATGVFSVRKGQTLYRDQVDSPELRLQSILDFAFTLLPRLIEAYEADTDWGDSKREKEILSAAAAIIERYRSKYPQLGIPPGDH